MHHIAFSILPPARWTFFYRTRVAVVSILRCARVLSSVCQPPPQPPPLLSGDFACMLESEGMKSPLLKAFPITLSKRFNNGMIVTFFLTLLSMYENIAPVLFPYYLFVFI